MSWLTGDWHQLLAKPWDNVALAAIVILCGALIGTEREKKVKPAGLRTMILIGLGSAVFTIISLELAGSYDDRGRIAAQVVSGIGFLGAGVILRDAGGVRGLTTAATIWVMASIGMLGGAGYGGAALGLAFAVLAVLMGASVLENRYIGPCVHAQVVVRYDGDDGKIGVKIDAILDDFQIPPEARKSRRCEDGSVELTLTYCNAHKHHKAFLLKFAEMPEIKAIGRFGYLGEVNTPLR